MINMVYISPSLLSADMSCLAEEIRRVQNDADFVHCDVMDDHFVPNLTFGAPVIKSISKHKLLPLDVHLMIEEPGRWLDYYLEAGLTSKDYLTFHFEAEKNPLHVINRIREKGIHPGISIKPKTSFEEIAEIFPTLDMLLIMTVEPGFGNQEFMDDMLPKIKAARRAAHKDQIIAIDGGINLKTAPLAVSYGANFLVAGGAIYGQDDPVQAIKNIRNAVEEVDPVWNKD